MMTNHYLESEQQDARPANHVNTFYFSSNQNCHSTLVLKKLQFFSNIGLMLGSLDH